MTKKFGFLHFIAGFYKVIGIILLIIGFFGAVALLLTSILGATSLEDINNMFGMHNSIMLSGVLGGIVGAFFFLIAFGFGAICQFAISEAIYVFLAIEENTRAAAVLLTRQE